MSTYKLIKVLGLVWVLSILAAVGSILAEAQPLVPDCKGIVKSGVSCQIEMHPNLYVPLRMDIAPCAPVRVSLEQRCVIPQAAFPNTVLRAQSSQERIRIRKPVHLKKMTGEYYLVSDASLPLSCKVTFEAL